MLLVQVLRTYYKKNNKLLTKKFKRTNYNLKNDLQIITKKMINKL